MQSENFSYYGSKNFIAEAKKVMNLSKIRETEQAPMPLAIYDSTPNETSLVGFVLTEKYFYDYNRYRDGILVLCLDYLTKIKYNPKKYELILYSSKSGKDIIDFTDKDIAIYFAVGQAF